VQSHTLVLFQIAQFLTVCSA